MNERARWRALNLNRRFHTHPHRNKATSAPNYNEVNRVETGLISKTVSRETSRPRTAT